MISNLQRRGNILPENINYKALGIVILISTYTIIPSLIYLLFKTIDNRIVHNFLVLLILTLPVVIWVNRLITFTSYRLIS